MHECVICCRGLFSVRERSQGEVNDPYLVACHAFHPVAELSLEIIDDDTVVCHSIEIPFLFTGNLSRQNFQLRFSFRPGLNALSLKYTVEILMQSVKQENHEFLGIMLISICKLGGIDADGFLEPTRQLGDFFYHKHKAYPERNWR